MGFFPDENPQLLSLIIIDEPKPPYHWGGQGAAIAFKRIMKRIINMDDSISPPFHESPSKAFRTHEVSKENIVKYDSKEIKNIPIELSAKVRGHTGVRIPELRGFSMRKAMNALNSKGIVPEMVGSGKVAWQNPSPGTLVQTGDICKVGLK